MYDLSGVPGYWLVVRRSRVVGLRARGHLAASETAGTATGDYLHTAPSQPTPLRGNAPTQPMPKPRLTSPPPTCSIELLTHVSFMQARNSPT